MPALGSPLCTPETLVKLLQHARCPTSPAVAYSLVAAQRHADELVQGAVVLAQRHFPADPLAAVPCAISSVVHSVLGSALAGWWRLRRDPTDERVTSR